MAAVYGITFNNQLFTSKKKAQQAFNAFLETIPLHKEIAIDDSRYGAVLWEYCTRFYHNQDLVPQIRGFVISMSDDHYRNIKAICGENYRRETIVRNDIESPGNTPAEKAAHKKKKDVKLAFRWEVNEQKEDFARTVPCPPDIESPEVDHVAPQFVELMRSFSKIFLKPGELPSITKVADGKGQYLFVDRELAEQWKLYHAQHAKLQWLSAEENRHKSRAPREKRQ